jgi:large subunit ribosomal protein L21
MQIDVKFAGFAKRRECIIMEGKYRKDSKKSKKEKEYMKYAIAQTSGKQFLLKPGQWYDVDSIKDANLGDFIYLNKILFFRKDDKIQIGKPFLVNSQIPAKIIQQVKGPKITVLKTKPKKKYTRTRGHRQSYTRVQIDSLDSL